MTFKVDINGISEHLMDAADEKSALKLVEQKFGKRVLKGRTISLVEWKPYTVEELIAELSKYPKKTLICIPNIGGTRNSQFLPIVKAIVPVETVLTWPKSNKKQKVKKMLCLETDVQASNRS